ncbi:MAG: hypothetical protein R2856_02935 [Caldilineaceae bacterium]
MRYILGGVRAVLVLLLVALAVVMVPVSLLPFKIGRGRPALWVIIYATRVFNVIFNIRVHCADHALLRRHEGFIFLNHLSFVEAFALLSLTPSRYLRRWNCTSGRWWAGWRRRSAPSSSSARTRHRARKRGASSPKSSPAAPTRR